MNQHVASVREEMLRLPTYHIAEDPNPPLFSAWDPWVYPYPKQDEILRPKDEEQTYRALVLENPYLRVTVLPELGGRVYEAYDKTASRDIFHKPDVIKPALIGLRGAWICGGIEFNFIKGHHVMTVSPVDYVTRQNADGSVSVVVGHTERASRARWSVTLTLYPDRSYLQTELRLYNRYRYRLDFYQWSNSSVVARNDLRCPYPTDYVISSGRKLYRFPIQGGVDISRWPNTPVAHDFFSIGSDRDFMGVYYDDDDMGMVHYANHHEAPGKKLFTWGTEDAGRIWDYILADSDTPYIEPQSGCVVDQSTFLFLQPHQVVEWREFWWGVRGIKSFVEVNSEAALNLAPVGDDKTLLGVNTTRRVEGARLTLIANGSVLYQASLNIAPDAPYCSEIAIAPSAWKEADTQLILADGAGRELARYHKPQPDMFAKVELPKPFEPQVDVRSSAEELAIAANEAEKLRDYARAEDLYQRALALDPGYARAHAYLGALYSRQGLYRRAYDALIQAVRRDPDLGLAHYHLGIVCREMGDPKAARTHFWATRLDPAFASQSFYFLGEMALADNDVENAATFFERSLALNRLHIKGHVMLALALRKLGRTAEAKVILGEVIATLDPADVFAHAELWRLDPSDERLATLRARLGDDPQVIIELACDYAAAAQWQDAIATLHLWPGVAQGQAAFAMIYYHLAYYHDKLGETDAARQLYGLAAQMAPDYVFPHRLEELAILTRTLDANPGDAQAWAYRGTLLYALRRQDEARADWRRSLVIKPMAVTYRNLGKSLWKDCADLAGAREQYERAIALNSQDHRLYSDLADILAELGAPAEQRVALLERAPRHGRVQARLAAALVALKQWERAIQIMQKMQYDPYEGERDTRPAYYEAYIGRGLERYESGDLAGALSDFEAALAYPRNVGVGKGHFAQDAQAAYWAGMAAAALGDTNKAQRYWAEGAAIRFRPQDDDLVSPFEGYQPDARHYMSLCLQKLGRAEEAARLF